MNYSSYYFTIDLQGRATQVNIPVFNADTGRCLYITLTDGGNDYNIFQATHASLVGKRDGKVVIFGDCTINDEGAVVYEFSQVTASVSGVMECEIRLYGENGLILTTPSFTLTINPRVAVDWEITLPEVDYNTLDRIILSERERIAAENARISAEEARAIAHLAGLDSLNLAVAAANSASAHTVEVANEILEGFQSGEYLPSVGEDGAWYVNGSSTGVQSKGEKGDKGDKGEKGDKGDKGDSGTDGAAGVQGDSVVSARLNVAQDNNGYDLSFGLSNGSSLYAGKISVPSSAVGGGNFVLLYDKDIMPIPDGNTVAYPNGINGPSEVTMNHAQYKYIRIFINGNGLSDCIIADTSIKYASSVRVKPASQTNSQKYIKIFLMEISSSAIKIKDHGLYLIPNLSDYTSKLSDSNYYIQRIEGIIA